MPNQPNSLPRSSTTADAPADVSAPLVVVTVAALLPYLSFWPLTAPTQVQPWAAVLAWLWVTMRLVTNGLRITGLQWTLVAFSVWFMLYIQSTDEVSLETYFRRSAAFILSAGIFLACQYLTPMALWRALRISLPFWLAFAILRYASPSVYFAIVTQLVPTVVESNARGTSSLAPEATDFGFMMVFLVVFCMITRRRLQQEGEHAAKWPLVVAIVCSVLSQSGTGYIGLAVVGLLYLATQRSSRYSQGTRYFLATLLALPVLLILQSLNSTSGVRGLDLILTTLRTPHELIDTTLSYRIAHNVVGVLGMLDSNLKGYGAGSFITEAPDIYVRHAVGRSLGLNDYYTSSVYATLSESPVSQFAVILLEFGLVGLVYLVVLYTFAFRSQIPYRPVAVGVLILAWLNSFPAAWPPFWVMIGIMMSPGFRDSGFRQSDEQEDSAHPSNSSAA